MNEDLFASHLACLAQNPQPFQKPVPTPNSLLEHLRRLSPTGFERLCMELLRKLGFEDLALTPPTADGGVDGYAALRINELLRIPVVFQCKLNWQRLSSRHVRDFRGAMAGRADYGVFFTTGAFTSAARKEATREGLPHIELVEGGRLANFLIRLSLGVTTRPAYELDEKFFREFEESIR